MLDVTQGLPGDDFIFSGNNTTGTNIVEEVTRHFAIKALSTKNFTYSTFKQMNKTVKYGTEEKLMSLMREFGAHLVYTWRANDGKVCTHTYVWATGAADFHLNINVPKSEPDYGHTFHMTAVSSRPSDLEKMAAITVHDVPPRPRTNPNPGYVYLLTLNRGVLELLPAAYGAVPIVRRNYSSEVLRNFDLAAEELNSEKPSGKLVILEGAPGTGKTHLVRALMSSVPIAKFIIVSPDLTSELGKPEFIRCLLSTSEGCRSIIVLEDAETCLTERNSANMNSISAILNLSDGIIGAALDLRIIATTNTALGGKTALDEALLRPGRLSVRLHVDKLNIDQSRGILYDLVHDWAAAHREIKEDRTLAEIYGIAHRIKRELKNEALPAVIPVN